MRTYLLAVLAVIALVACDRSSEADGPAAEGAAPTEGQPDEAAADEAAAPAADEAATGGAHGAGTVDRSDPAAIVQAMLDVATSTDWAVLGDLCPPEGGNDNDTQRICNLATEPGDRAEYIEVFRGGTVNGDATIEGDTARVPFLFGETRRDPEEMRLVRIDDRWYLQSF